MISVLYDILNTSSVKLTGSSRSKGGEMDTLNRWFLHRVFLVGCALTFCVIISANLPVSAQVLGACGTPSEDSPATAEVSAELVNKSVLLPGQRAINFELPAVVGDEIKTVKLSDYNGKWRVLCFYPADFTFV